MRLATSRASIGDLSRAQSDKRGGGLPPSLTSGGASSTGLIAGVPDGAPLCSCCTEFSVPLQLLQRLPLMFPPSLFEESPFHSRGYDVKKRDGRTASSSYRSDYRSDYSLYRSDVTELLGLRGLLSPSEQVFFYIIFSVQ